MWILCGEFKNIPEALTLPECFRKIQGLPGVGRGESGSGTTTLGVSVGRGMAVGAMISGVGVADSGVGVADSGVGVQVGVHVGEGNGVSVTVATGLSTKRRTRLS